MASNKIKKKRAKRGSFFLRKLDRFTAFIYSIFRKRRIGTHLSVGDTGYIDSVCAEKIESGSQSVIRNKFSLFMETVMEKSRVMKLLGNFRSFLFCLSVSVYGLFFMVFGSVSVFAYYLAMFLDGAEPHGESALITSSIIVICSIPMLFSNASVASLISESKSLRRLVVSFLSIPEKKLKPAKKYSGAEYMFFAAVAAVALGILTYFYHPGYVPTTLMAIIVFCVITANPESGLIITVGAIPFLQFVEADLILLVLMVLVTFISYILKVVRHRRVVRINAETVILLIFCGFVLVAGVFSPLGGLGFAKSVYAVLIIFSGFFLTYNLMHGEGKLLACSKILMLSFFSVALIGLIKVFYDGIAKGATYSAGEYVQALIEEGNFVFYDGAGVFGTMAVLVFPLMLAHMASKKTVSGVVVTLIMCCFSVASVFVYSSYETVIILAVEFCIFWLMYSNKTLNAVLIALIPIGILIIAYPYISASFGLPAPVDYVMDSMPPVFNNSPEHIATVQSSMNMLADGNLTGIGVGNDVFIKLHSTYANVVSVNAGDPSSFFLQVICWSGIVGFIAFAIFMLTLFRESYGYMITSRDKVIKRNTLALFCSFFAAMIYGSVNCLWNDMRMLFLFFAAAGLLSGYIREGREKEKVREGFLASDETNSELELRFYK